MKSFYRAGGYGMKKPWGNTTEFHDLLREAETLIEGKPQPGK